MEFFFKFKNCALAFFFRSCFTDAALLSKTTRIICNYFFFSCIVKTKSNFKMGKFCNFFSRPIKGEVKNGRGALLPRARTRRSSGQTQRNNKAIDNTQAKAHTFAFYSPFLFLYYNLSSLSLSLFLLSIWIAFYFIVVLPVAELAGMWKNDFLAQFDPFPVVFFFVFVVFLNKIKRIIAKCKRMDTLKIFFCSMIKRNFYFFISLFVRSNTITSKRETSQRPTAISPILDSITLLHTHGLTRLSLSVNVQSLPGWWPNDEIPTNNNRI